MPVAVEIAEHRVARKDSACAPKIQVHRSAGAPRTKENRDAAGTAAQDQVLLPIVVRISDKELSRIGAGQRLALAKSSITVSDHDRDRISVFVVHGEVDLAIVV